MTFAEYNTDDYFNNKDSTADGLIKAAYDEGKTREEVEKSLSPLWKEDKKGNVKKALDTYYKIEEPKAEEKTAPKVEEMTQTTEALKPEEKKENETTSAIRTKDKNFMEGQNAIQDVAEDEEMKRQKELEQQRWEETNNRMKKTGEAFGSIDDKLIDQLPTFMWRRYQNGEFGDPKSSDAKLRLAYFAINNVVSKLKMVANADAAARGQGTLFQNTESAYDQYQNSNLAQGLENRWSKYKQETQAAIDLAKQEGTDEQDLQSSIAKISSNNRLNTAFNMMNENQKAYTLQVLSRIGGDIGNMNNKDFVNTLIGYATSGDNLSWQEAAELLVARFGKDAIGVIKSANENGATEGGEEVTAGVTGSQTKTTLSDGSTVETSGKLGTMTDDDYKNLTSKADTLIKDYYNGKIDKATFEKDYGALVSFMDSHKAYKTFKGNIKSIKDIYKENKPYEAKEIFGEKKYKDGLKSVEYFEKDPSLFEYFKNTENPNYLEAKEKSKNIKDIKAYNKALEHYNKLKDTKGGKGLTLVDKW